MLELCKSCYVVSEGANNLIRDSFTEAVTRKEYEFGRQTRQGKLSLIERTACVMA